jgi:heme-degrading monooxygenase HmoA
MIIAVVEFELGKSVTLDEAARMFEGSAPKYRGLPGLLRKHYIRSEDGQTVGGVYIWKSREAADAVYNDEWRSFVTDKYGQAPVVRFFDNPVSVDNTA